MENCLSSADIKKLTITWWILKITYGLYWGIIGSDKFFGLVTESENRVSNVTLSLMSLSLPRLLQVVGIAEIFIAFLILTWWPRYGAYAGIVLMAAIVLNLVLMGAHYDIAIHGATIGMGMIAFVILTSILRK